MPGLWCPERVGTNTMKHHLKLAVLLAGTTASAAAQDGAFDADPYFGKLPADPYASGPVETTRPVGTAAPTVPGAMDPVARATPPRASLGRTEVAAPLPAAASPSVAMPDAVMPEGAAPDALPRPSTGLASTGLASRGLASPFPSAPEPTLPAGVAPDPASMPDLAAVPAPMPAPTSEAEAVSASAPTSDFASAFGSEATFEAVPVPAAQADAPAGPAQADPVPRRLAAYVEARTGWDGPRGANRDDGVLAGVTVGVDYTIARAVGGKLYAGLLGSVDVSSARRSGAEVVRDDSGADPVLTLTEVQTSETRDVEVGGRLGWRTDRFGFYAMAALSNRKRETETIATTFTELVAPTEGEDGTATPGAFTRDDVERTGVTGLFADGWRVGAGAEARVFGPAYLHVGYRYADYDESGERHQVLTGMGARF